MPANDTMVGGDHYKGVKVQHWDFAADHDYDFFQYQITKYIDRWKKKNGLQDLLKAQHFLAKYIEMHEAYRHRGFMDWLTAWWGPVAPHRLARGKRGAMLAALIGGMFPMRRHEVTHVLSPEAARILAQLIVAITQPRDESNTKAALTRIESAMTKLSDLLTQENADLDDLSSKVDELTSRVTGIPNQIKSAVEQALADHDIDDETAASIAADLDVKTKQIIARATAVLHPDGVMGGAPAEASGEGVTEVEPDSTSAEADASGGPTIGDEPQGPVNT